MSEFELPYRKDISNLLERCIKLGYKGFFTMPHSTPRGYEIEILLAIEWMETMFFTDHERTYAVIVADLPYDFVTINSLDGYAGSVCNGRFKTKQEAQLAAIEKGLEILESKDDE